MKICDAHYVDPEIKYCVGCIKKWIDQRHKLLDFVNKVSDIPEIKKIPSFRILYQIQEDACELLKEIGER